ncbi:hypothetical protein H4R18_005809 [Coemansia javaensis]|uniref:Uncharacterized protein n=1 Tax=Coemansia javaensis TaxID=2761396 RepID=A0A9W8H7F1_9FUNG|nr:hypothetical protein H4R18_005809 [Coemansia javaensis]
MSSSSSSAAAAAAGGADEGVDGQLRRHALDALERSAAEADAVGAYHHARRMRAGGLLRARDGRATAHVGEDPRAGLAVARAVAGQQRWDRCVDCLALILDRARQPRADAAVARAAAEAALSPRLGALPERRAAGLTALQLIEDFALADGGGGGAALALRACGFVASRRRLQALLRRVRLDSLDARARFEAALAHVRCGLPDAAAEQLARLDLAPAQRVEAEAAMCVAYAETARFEAALDRLAALDGDAALWAALGGGAAEQRAAVGHVRLSVVHAAAAGLLPRLAFTENLHTPASRRASPRFAPQRSAQVVALLARAVADVRRSLRGAARAPRDLHSRLFGCECLVYALAGPAAAAAAGLALTLPLLAARLHALQRELARHVRSLGGDPSDCGGGGGAAYASALLQSFLWAAALRPEAPRRAAAATVRRELRHAAWALPGFEPSVADLEPALAAALPAAVWATALRGNFKDDAAFMLADELLSSPPRAAADPIAADLAAMARRAQAQPAADLRLYPLLMVLAVAQGHAALAARLAAQALRAPLLCVRPGTLALVPARDAPFKLRLALALAMTRAGADVATTALRAEMRAVVGSQPAAALLYSCVRARNEPVARDIVAGLATHPRYGAAGPSPRIMELHMRVCVRAGHMARALHIFHRLSYGAAATQLGDPSFVQLIDYMADQRESAAGAEHAFDAWLQIADYRGLASPALVERWRAVGLGPDARRAKSRFLPRSGATVADALAAAGVPRRASGELASRHYLTTWEFHVVTALIGAYVTSGHARRAAAWERWLLDAIHDGRIAAKPAYVLRIARIMQRRLEHGTWDHVRPCLDLVAAIGASVGGPAALARAPYPGSLQPAVKLFAAILRNDRDGAMAAQIRAHLEQRDAAYVFELVARQA